jgi:hypothetical protein
MPILPRGVAQPSELIKSLNALSPLDPSHVVKWDFTVGNDWSGDPAIFFLIILSDSASNPRKLRQVTSAIVDTITKKIDPLNQWGLIPYFSFRSQSEQAKLKEEVARSILDEVSG